MRLTDGTLCVPIPIVEPQRTSPEGTACVMLCYVPRMSREAFEFFKARLHDLEAAIVVPDCKPKQEE